jgi:hypothetical protein
VTAFVAVLVAIEGLLLGGVRRHESTPFAKRADAEAWLAQAIETNQGAGRKAEGKVKQVMAARSRVIA